MAVESFIFHCLPRSCGSVAMHQSISGALIHSLANCGVFVCLFSPGGGALTNFAWPRVRAFAKPRATPELLVHTKKILIAAVYFHFVDPL